MKYKKIEFYTRNRIPLSVRCLALRGKREYEVLYDTIEDAESPKDLLSRLRIILADPIQEERVTDEYVRYLVTDVWGNQRYLKIVLKAPGRKVSNGV